MQSSNIDYSTLDFTGVKEEDLTTNENFQTMEIGEKRKFTKALTDFNNFDPSTTRAFNAIIEADHIGFNSSGATREKNFKEAEAIRSALRESLTLRQSGELTEEKHNEIKTNLVSQLKTFESDLKNAPNEQAELREAALGFERANNGVVENSKIGGDKKQLEEARVELDRFIDIFEKNGITPTEKKGLFEDIGSRGLRVKNENESILDKGSFTTEEFKAVKKDAEEFTAFKGEPIFKDRHGEFIVRPHSVLLDPDGISETIQNSDAPSITKQELLLQADNIKKNAPINFIKDLSEFGKNREEVGDRILNKFNAELESQKLNKINTAPSDLISNYISDKESGGQTGVSKIFNAKELSILDKIVLGEVSDFTKNEDDKSKLRRLVEVSGRGFVAGSENIATLPVSVANLASPEGSSINKITTDILDAVDDKRRSQANLDQLRENDGLEFQLTTAITQEIPSLLVTRGLGKVAGGGKTGTSVATAFGVGRETLSSVEEMRKEGKSKEQQLRAGILTGITSFITTQAFNKLGAGGVENFDDAAKRGLKSGISKILKDTLGEGSEEFIQTLTQSAILNAERHWNDTQSFSDSLDEAMLAFFVGGIMGGAPSTLNAITDNRIESTTDKSTKELQEVADALLDRNSNAIVNSVAEDDTDISGERRILQTDNTITEIQDENTEDSNRGNDSDSIEDGLTEADTKEDSNQVTPESGSDLQGSETNLQRESPTIEETSDPDSVNESEVSVSQNEESDTQPDLSITGDTQSSEPDQVPESSVRETPDVSPVEVAQDESSGSQELFSEPLPDDVDDAKLQVAQEIVDVSKRGDLTKDQAVNFGKRLEKVDSIEDIRKVRDAVGSFISDVEPTPEAEVKTSDSNVTPAEQKFKDRVINNLTDKGDNAKRSVSSSSLFSTNPAREVEVTNDAIIESLGAEQAGQIVAKIQTVESSTGQTLNDQIDLITSKRADSNIIDKSEVANLAQARILKSIHNKIKNGQSVDEAVQSVMVHGEKTKAGMIENAIRTIRGNQVKSKEADELNRNSVTPTVDSSRKASISSQLRGAKIKDASSTKQRAFIDSGALSHVSSQLPRNASVQVVDVDHPVLSKVIKSVSSLFGAKVVFYQTSNSNSSVDDGFTIAGDSTIYIDVDSSRSITQVIGHEAAHVLQTESPNMFNALIESLVKSGVINKVSPAYIKFLARRGYQTDIYDSQFHKEYTADLIGRIFEDMSHLDRVRGDINNDGVFKRFTNALLTFINKLKLKLRDFVAGVLPDANGKMFNALNDSLLATYILNETLSSSVAIDGIPSYSAEAHTTTYALKTLQNQAEGYLNPQAQTFVDLTDVSSSKKAKIEGKKGKKKSINEGDGSVDDFKKFYAEANPLKDTAVSAINKIAEERGWVVKNDPEARVDSIVVNFAGTSERNQKNVRELISRMKDEYQGEQNLHDSLDGDVVASLGIKLAMIDALRDVTSQSRKEELFSVISKKDIVVQRAGGISSLNQEIRHGAQLLSILGNLGADAEGSGYRYFAGLSVSAAVGLKKNNINAIGQKDHDTIVKSLNDESDSDRILALMEKNSKLSESLNVATDTLIRQREATLRLVDRLAKQLETFSGKISSSAKTKAQSQHDSVLDKLHEVSAINSKKGVLDLESLIDDANRSIEIIDSIDFSGVIKNPKFKRNVDAVKQSNKELKETIKRTNEDTDGETEQDDGDYFLVGKIKGFQKSIKNAIKARDVSEHQRIYGIESTKYKIGESTLEEATAAINSSEPFQDSSIDNITEALKADKKTAELLAKEKDLQTGKRKIYDAQNRQIQARKNKPKAVKKYSPADTLSKLNKGTLTLDRAVNEVRSNIEGVVDEHVEAYLLEGMKTSNKRAKARLQSSVDRHIGESLHSSTLKLARSLGVSSFKSQQINVKSWGDLTTTEKSTQVSTSEFIPKSARNKANTARIVAHLDTLNSESELNSDVSIETLEAINTTIKDSKITPSTSMSNWLKKKISDDPTFWHELPSKKLDVIREYFEEGRNDPEMAGVFSELINGEITDTSLNRLAETAMKRLQKAAQEVADDKAKKLRDQLDTSRFSLSELTEAISMGLFDKTVSRDAIISEMLGDDFSISGKGIEQIAANRRIIESMIADGVAQPYATDIGVKAMRDIKRILTRELRHFNNSIPDALQASDTASVLSSGTTVIALPMLGAFTLASTVAKQPMQLAYSGKNNPDFTRAQRLKLMKDNLLDAFNLPDIGASAVNGLLHGSHAISKSNLDTKVEGELDAQMSVLDTRMQNLIFSKNKIQKMNEDGIKLDAEGLKAYRDATVDTLLALKSIPTAVFNIMQSLTEVFAEPARKLGIALEAQDQILQGNLTLNQYKTLKEAAANKAKSALATIEVISPDIPWYSKRIMVNQMLNQEIFQTYVQDLGIQEAQNSIAAANLSAVGLAGDTNENIGVISALNSSLSSFLGRPLTHETRNFVGYASKGARFTSAYFFKFFNTAARSIDAAIYYTPIGYLVGTLGVKHGLINSKNHTGVVKKIAEGIENYNTEGRAQKERFEEMLIGMPFIVGYVMQAFMIPEEEDRLFHMDLSYPEKTKDQVTFMEEADRREYKLYINTKHGRIGADMGRGALSQALLPLLIATRVETAIENTHDKDVFDQTLAFGYQGLLLGRDAINLGSPFADSIINEFQRGGEKRFDKQVKKTLARAIDFVPAGFANDVDKIRFGRRSMSDDAPLSAYMPSMQLFNQFSEYKGKRLTQSGDPVDDVGFWNKLSALNSPITFRENDITGLSGDMKKANEIRQKAHYGLGSRSDYATWSKKFYGTNVPMNIKNAYAKSRGYDSDQHMHEIAILTRTKKADRATARRVNDRELNGHIDAIANPEGKTSQARVNNVKKSVEAASAILRKDYSAATTEINGSGRFRAQDGTIKKGLNKSAVKDFIDNYEP